jgi:hypothetical protein
LSKEQQKVQTKTKIEKRRGNINKPTPATDYRREDRRQICESTGGVGAIRSVLTPSFRKPRSSPPKNEAFSQAMHLKIPLLSQGLEL